MPAIEDLVGHNIKFYRQLKGLTQENLAEMANVSSAYIGYLERGKKTPSLDVLVRVANVLKISPDKLLEPNHEEDYELKKFISLISDKGSDFLVFINSVTEAYFKSVNGKNY
jgi:transcriptional regulator with XRE-family HTH domain